MFDFVEIKNTVAGREIFAEGVGIGEARGEARVLVKIATKHFHPLPPVTAEAILELDYLQLEMLSEDILDLPDLAALKRWLADA